MPWAEALRLGNCAESMVRAGKTKEGFTGEEGEGAHGKMVILRCFQTLKCVFLCFKILRNALRFIILRRTCTKYMDDS